MTVAVVTPPCAPSVPSSSTFSRSSFWKGPAFHSAGSGTSGPGFMAAAIRTNTASLAALADRRLRATPDQSCDAIGACTDLCLCPRRADQRHRSRTDRHSVTTLSRSSKASSGARVLGLTQGGRRETVVGTDERQADGRRRSSGPWDAPERRGPSFGRPSAQSHGPSEKGCVSPI